MRVAGQRRQSVGAYPSWWPSDTPRPWRLGGRHGGSLLLGSLIPVGVLVVFLVAVAGSGQWGPVALLALVCFAAAVLSFRYVASNVGWEEVVPSGVRVRRLIGTRHYDVRNLQAITSDVVLTRQRPIRHIWLHFEDEVLMLAPNTSDTQGPAVELRLRACFEPVIEARARWVRQAEDVPLSEFGEGAADGFERFVDFESIVPVRSLSDAEAWLRDCTFEHDADGWMHPVDFEAWRHGNVVDHALWAWRRLAQAGYSTEFVVGDRLSEPHAWVMVEVDGAPRIFETLMAERSMLVDSFTGPVEYRPRVGIDFEFNTYRYGS